MSDIFKILSVVGAYEYAGGGHKFCADHFVRPKVRRSLYVVFHLCTHENHIGDGRDT